jgi:hypothetical protein
MDYNLAVVVGVRVLGGKAMTRYWQRREFVKAGLGIAGGLLGDGLIGRVPATELSPRRSGKSVIYIFLSGGLSQLDSFDLKPEAPDEIRGEFRPMATATPGIHICEHLPRLAQRSRLWALVRSMTHPSTSHSHGHAMMLTGRTTLQTGFDPNRPQASDWPSLAAIAGRLLPRRGPLPPALVLPEKLVHMTGRIIPGQFAGQMGTRYDPWFIEASPFRARIYGAYPEYAFTMQPEAPGVEDQSPFQAPNLGLPDGITASQMRGRLSLLEQIQRHPVRQEASAERFERQRERALSLLSDRRVRAAFDVTNADRRLQDKYGKNSFGWSLLMARTLIDLGVSFVQVNLGNNESWDLHGSIFPRLKDSLFPPTDRALSALLDDLEQTGQLQDTMIVMAGEFGRTPRISTLPQHYRLPGRDHWGPAQTVFFAGGGVRGGQVIGSTDRSGGHPAGNPQTPENMAASIYHALGIPQTAAWHDQQDRPHHIYHGEPIAGLM